MKDAQKTSIQLIAELEQLRVERKKLKARLARLRRRQKDSALNESKYRLLVENAIEGIVIIQDGVFKFANPVVSAVLGYSMEEMKGLTVMPIIHRDDRENVQNLIGINEETAAAPQLASFRVITREGQERLLGCLVMTVEWEGRPAQLYFIRDNTNLVRLEQELHREQVRQQVIMDAAPVGIAVINNRIVRWSNSTMEKLFGYGHGELAGKDTRIFYASDAAYEQAGRRVYPLEEGVTHEADLKFMRRDGSEIDCLFRAVLLDRTRDSETGIAMVLDVTDSRRAWELLRQSEADLALAQRVARVGNWKYDSITGRSVWSEELYRIFEIDQDGQHDIYRELFEHIHPDDRQRVKEANRKVLREGGPLELEYRYITRDGTLKHINETRQPIHDAAGTITGAFGIAQDITERKNMEDALSQGEARLRAIADSLPGIVYQFYIDDNGKWGVHFVGRRSKELYGIDAEPIDTWYERFIACIAPEYLEKFLSSIQDSLTQMIPWELEVRYITPEGRQKYIHGMSQPVRSGTEVQFNGIALDVTGRRRAEQTLVYVLFELAQGLTSISGLDGQMSHLCRIAANAIGCDRSSIFLLEDGYYRARYNFGNPDDIALLFPGFKVSRESPLITHAVQSRDTVIIDNPLLSPLMDSTVAEKARIFSIVVAALFNIDGSPFGFITAEYNEQKQRFSEQDAILLKGVARQAELIWRADQSRQEKQVSEKLLQKSEEKYRSIVETTGAGVAVVGLDGDITFVNDILCRKLGYSYEQLTGSPFLDLVHPDDRQRIAESFAYSIEHPSPELDIEFRHLHRDGHPIWFHTCPTAVYDDGKMSGFSALVIDVTESKRMEAELQASRQQLASLAGQLQAAREEERRVVAREIHDNLGQSLTALQIDLDWLSRRLPAQTPLAYKAGDMAKLIVDLNDMVRQLATDLRPPLLDDLGLCTAMRSYIEEFESRTLIRCFWKCPDEDISLDPQRAIALYRVMQEGLTNIARHAGATEAKVQVNLNMQMGRLMMEISDNGKGIAEPDIRDKRSLGIIGMKERIAYYGGDVQIQSKPGQGTCLIIDMPFEENYQID